MAVSTFSGPSTAATAATAAPVTSSEELVSLLLGFVRFAEGEQRVELGVEERELPDGRVRRGGAESFDHHLPKQPFQKQLDMRPGVAKLRWARTQIRWQQSSPWVAVLVEATLSVLRLSAPGAPTAPPLGAGTGGGGGDPWPPPQLQHCLSPI